MFFDACACVFYFHRRMRWGCVVLRIEEEKWVACVVWWDLGVRLRLAAFVNFAIAVVVEFVADLGGLFVGEAVERAIFATEFSACANAR